MSQPTQADPRGLRSVAAVTSCVLAGLLHEAAGPSRGHTYVALHRFTPVDA